jgi:hypothetical protein
MSALPDLDALRRNDSAAWDRLHLWLSPEARRSARFHLIGFPEAEVKDVAGEAICLLVESVKQIAANKGSTTAGRAVPRSAGKAKWSA